MFLFLIILILLGALMEILSLRRDPSLLEMDYSISTDAAEPGKPFAVQTVLTNKSRIPVSYLAVREYYPEYAVVPDGVTTQAARTGLLVRNICRMKSRRRKKLALEVSISKRGVHIFTADSIEFGDFLGFRVISKKIALQREIVIYPEALENPGLSQALSSFCGDIAARRFLIRDPILTAGAREYTAREPMKEIHWPQTAKRGCLMVREFEYSRQPSACVILNVEGAGPEESDMDKLCSVTRAVCQALINTGASVSFLRTRSSSGRSGGAYGSARLHRCIWECSSRGSAGRLPLPLPQRTGFCGKPCARAIRTPRLLRLCLNMTLRARSL